TLLGQLEPHAPDRVLEYRGRGHKLYKRSIIDELGMSNLTEADWQTIEENVRDLSARDPALAVDLQSRMRERRSAAIRFIDLEPPFAGLDAVFVNTDWLKVGANELRRIEPGNP